MVPRMNSSGRRLEPSATNPPAEQFFWHLSDDDRVGPPVTGRRRPARLLGVVLIALAIGGGWTALRHETFGPWLVSSVQEVLTSANKPTARPADPTPPGPLTASPSAHADATPSPITTATILTTDQPEPPSPAALPHASTIPPASGANSATSTPAGAAYLPAAQPDADPLVQRAAAAGLHAGLSRAILARLSTADFQSAATAIRKAIAETPDNGELVWPSQRAPRQALFKVHFVAGAAPQCRRYVVTITKDGWSTTALPMERCGSPAPATQRARG